VTVNDQDPYSVDHTDQDPDETAEWQESLDALVGEKGRGRGRDVMLSLLKRSKELHLGVPMVPTTDYINTIAPENEPDFPGNEELERRYRAWIRWNAAMLRLTRSPMMATSVVSLNSEMKLETMFGIEIFSACGMITSRIDCQ